MLICSSETTGITVTATSMVNGTAKVGLKNFATACINCTATAGGNYSVISGVCTATTGIMVLQQQFNGISTFTSK
jgi:hypothetical protein